MKLFYIFLLVGCFSSCTLSDSATKSNFQLTELSADEMAKFTTKGKSIYYANEKVATVGSFDYEYYEGNYALEVSMIQHSPIYNEMTEKIVYFMSTTYPYAKIEVKVEREAKEVLGLLSK